MKNSYNSNCGKEKFRQLADAELSKVCEVLNSYINMKGGENKMIEAIFPGEGQITSLSDSCICACTCSFDPGDAEKQSKPDKDRVYDPAP